MNHEATQNACRLGGESNRKDLRPYFSSAGCHLGGKDCPLDLSVYLTGTGGPGEKGGFCRMRNEREDNGK